MKKEVTEKQSEDAQHKELSYELLLNKIENIEKNTENLARENLQLKQEIKSLNIDGRLLKVEARIATSIDLTDDIVGNTGNLISYTEARIDQTLEHADMVLESADFMASTFLVSLSLGITIVGFLITTILGKKQNQLLESGVGKITRRLSKDEDFRDEFIRELAKHEELNDNINFAIDKVARERFEEANSRASEEEITELSEQLVDEDEEKTSWKERFSYMFSFQKQGA